MYNLTYIHVCYYVYCLILQESKKKAYTQNLLLYSFNDLYYVPTKTYKI